MLRSRQRAMGASRWPLPVGPASISGQVDSTEFRLGANEGAGATSTGGQMRRSGFFSLLLPAPVSPPHLDSAATSTINSSSAVRPWWGVSWKTHSCHRRPSCPSRDIDTSPGPPPLHLVCTSHHSTRRTTSNRLPPNLCPRAHP